uniref:Uncharacterized protein n=1 Tax=Oryza meridionalis TaxID=40149 RepID=A0A0E0BXY2_9ORYZ
MKLRLRSLDWIISRFSHPSGKPNSVAGKGSFSSCTARPAASTAVTNPAILAAFTGVVTRLTCAPCSASRRAMSVMGIMCPCAIIGTSTKCAFIVVDLRCWSTVWPAEDMAVVVSSQAARARKDSERDKNSWSRPDNAVGQGSWKSPPLQELVDCQAANSVSFGSKESDLWTIKQSEGRFACINLPDGAIMPEKKIAK